MLTKTDRVRRELRRYGGSAVDRKNVCPIWGTYHNASVFLDIIIDKDQVSGDKWPHDDQRWPKICDCGQYTFIDNDNWQIFTQHLWKRDTGDEYTLNEAPPGAMWYADWMTEKLDKSKVGNMWRGPDDRCLVVKCPDGHNWMIDDQASNCTMKEDKIHKCWVRHGVPPQITVDKITNGDDRTCNAGAGSIQTPKWHGFLTNGILSENRNPTS